MRLGPILHTRRGSLLEILIGLESILEIDRFSKDAKEPSQMLLLARSLVEAELGLRKNQMNYPTPNETELDIDISS